MKNQKTTHNQKRNFVWILTILMLIGILCLASINLAARDIWTKKADMPTARRLLGTSGVNGIIYAIGGLPFKDLDESLPTVEAYNPVTDTWTKKADMPTARYGLSTSVVDGIIYAIGGTSSYPYPGISAVEAYNPATDTWTKKADMLTPRAILSTSVIDGKIYAIGGIVGDGSLGAFSTVEVYDPAKDTWTKKADMPTARALLSTSAVAGKIYAIGGSDRGEANNWLSTSIVEIYAPVTNSWTSRAADMRTARGWLSTSVVGGKIYAIGGAKEWLGVGGLATVEAYDTGFRAVSPQGKLATTWGEMKLGR